MKTNNFNKHKTLIIFGLLLSLHMPALAFINNNIGIDAENMILVSNYTSRNVKITGTVCSSQITDHSKVIFLNFGKNFNTSLSAVIYDFDVHSFIDAGIDKPETYFNNKKVILKGVVRINNGKPEIVINSPKQIQVIN